MAGWCKEQVESAVNRESRKRGRRNSCCDTYRRKNKSGSKHQRTLSEKWNRTYFGDIGTSCFVYWTWNVSDFAKGWMSVFSGWCNEYVNSCALYVNGGKFSVCN